MKKATLLITLLFTITLFSQDFVVDNFNYNIITSEEPYTVEIDGFETEDTTLSILNIPDTVTYNDIEYTIISIAAHSFRGSGLYFSSSYSTVSIGENIKTIGDYAFYDGDVTRFIFRGNSLLETIGSRAFSRNADYFTSFTIPNSVTSIGSYAFADNNRLTIENFPQNLTFIGAGAFSEVLQIDVDNVNIPEGIVEINGYTFNQTSTNNITMDDSVISIGERAFYQSNILNLQIGSNVVSIDDEAFRVNPVKRLEIPNNVETIGESAFQGYSGSSQTFNRLTKVLIGSGVTSIGDYAFAYNNLLTKVISLSNTPPTISENVFSYKSEVDLFIPAGTATVYENAGWTGFKSVIEFTELPQVLEMTTNIATGTLTVDITPINGVYDKGTEIEITAVPNEGYEFVEWQGDIVGTENPINIIMDDDKEINAIFRATCIIDIPDENFKDALVYSNVTIDGVKMTIDTDGDLEISCEEATAFTGIIYTRFDSVSALTGLEYFVNATGLVCEYNDIASIDISQNIALTYIHCLGNPLTSLNLANGNNINFSYAYGSAIEISTNTNLTCIQVDDVAYSEANWSNIHPTASFSTDCSATASVVDAEFSNSLAVYPNPVENTLHITLQNGEVLAKAQVYNLLGEGIINSKEKEIDLSILKSGMYLLKIESEEGKVAIRKIIKD